MWPVVLEEYSRFPTLLYRFVRKANFEDFASQVQPAALATPAANPVQLAVAAAMPELEAQLAAQHSEDQVQPAGAAPEEAHPAFQGDNKKRRHQLVSE